MPKSEQITDPLVQDFSEYMQQHPELYLDFVNYISKNVKIDQLKTILEVGCGPGLLIKALNQSYPASTLIGLEPNQSMIQTAAHVLKDLPSNSYSLLQEKIEQCSMPTDSVDLVVTRFSVYAWEDPAKALEQITRILKPGGVLIFELLNKEFPRWKLFFIKRGMRKKHASTELIQFHVNAYETAFTQQKIKKMLVKQGFHNITLEGTSQEWMYRVVAYAPA